MGRGEGGEGRGHRTRTSRINLFDMAMGVGKTGGWEECKGRLGRGRHIPHKDDRRLGEGKLRKRKEGETSPANLAELTGREERRELRHVCDSVCVCVCGGGGGGV